MASSLTFLLKGPNILQYFSARSPSDETMHNPTHGLAVLGTACHCLGVEQLTLRV
jgi:hypothetical protein